MSYSVLKNKLRFDSGKVVEFKYDIAEALSCCGCVVLRLSVPQGVVFNENVYGISYEGSILWQVPPKKHVYAKSSYTGLQCQGNHVSLYNWDGGELVMNPITGEILEERYNK